MNINDAFPSKYLKASHIKGKQPRVTIDRVEMGDESIDHKPVLYFVGKELGLTLNVGNKDTLVEAFGEETDNWNGKQITLFVTKTQFQGKATDGIRIIPPTVEAPKPAAQAKTENPAGVMDDEIPF